MALLQVAWWLLVGHIFADFVFQSEKMVTLKSPAKRIAPCEDSYGPWWLWLLAHGIVNGAITARILGIWWVGPIEAMHHAATDYLKCTERITFWQDQLSHAVMKGLLLWVWWSLR